MKKSIFTIILLFIFNNYSPASTSDGLITVFPSDARAWGMAEGNSSIVNDSTALYYNPAGLGKIRSFSANYSFMSYIFGQQYHNLTGAYRMSGIGVFGLGISYLGDEAFNLTTPAGESEIEINNSNWLFNAGYCYELSKDILLGGNIKYMKEGYYLNDESISSSGVGFGLGAIIDNLFINNLGLSAVLRNMGFKSSYDNGTEGSMPFEAIIGGKYSIGLNMPVLSEVLLTTDISFNNYGRTGVRIGSEGIISRLSKDFLGFIRLGFQLPAPVENNFISFLFTGLGIKWKEFGIDYGVNFSGSDMGTVHFISVNYNM